MPPACELAGPVTVQVYVREIVAPRVIRFGVRVTW